MHRIGRQVIENLNLAEINQYLDAVKEAIEKEVLLNHIKIVC